MVNLVKVHTLRSAFKRFICNYGVVNLISSTRKEPLPLIAEKLNPQISDFVKPSLGAPVGCQSARRVKLDQGRVKCFHPLQLSVKRYSKRSDVSLLLPA